MGLGDAMVLSLGVHGLWRCDIMLGAMGGIRDWLIEGDVLLVLIGQVLQIRRRRTYKEFITFSAIKG